MSYLKGKKATIIWLTFIAMIMVVLSGCSQTSSEPTSIDDVFFNPEYVKEGMRTVSNKEFNYDNEILFGKFGISLGSPIFKEFFTEGRFTAFDNLDRIEFVYSNDVSEELAKKIKGTPFDSIDPDLLKEMDDNMVNFGALFYTTEGDENASKILEEFKGKFSNVESFGKNGKLTYYYAYNETLDSFSHIKLSAKDKSNIEKLMKEIPNLPNNSAIYPPGENSVCNTMTTNL